MVFFSKIIKQLIIFSRFLVLTSKNKNFNSRIQIRIFRRDILTKEMFFKRHSFDWKRRMCTLGGRSETYIIVYFLPYNNKYSILYTYTLCKVPESGHGLVNTDALVKVVRLRWMIHYFRSIPTCGIIEACDKMILKNELKMYD